MLLSATIIIMNMCHKVSNLLLLKDCAKCSCKQGYLKSYFLKSTPGEIYVKKHVFIH